MSSNRFWMCILISQNICMYHQNHTKHSKCEFCCYSFALIFILRNFIQKWYLLPKFFWPTHTIYTRNNMGQKCEGNCGLWVLNEILSKSIFYAHKSSLIDKKCTLSIFLVKWTKQSFSNVWLWSTLFSNVVPYFVVPIQIRKLK